MAIYQFLLAAGAPFGQAAWGGTHEGQLPVALRVGSGISVLVYALAAALVLQRAGLSHIRFLSDSVSRIGTWVVSGVFALAALANFASQSRWEQLLLGPLALALAVLCFVVARNGLPSPGGGATSAASGRLTHR
jgi:hypothetical protein